MTVEEIQQVGQWRVRRLLGQGGFSWVFEVEDPGSGKRKALKMLKPEAGKGDAYKRFHQEARLLAPEDDDHLIRIDLLGTDAATGNDYYVMELLTGRDLKQILKEEGALPPERAVEIFAGVLQALAIFHAKRPPVIHRDVKLANIQVTHSGRAKLLDFGIAKVIKESDDTIVDDRFETVANQFIGTVGYAAPEQIHLRELGPRSDVFSMGLCLYETLEGHHVYADVPDLPTQTYQDVLTYYARLLADRSEIELRFKRTPSKLQPVIRKALAARPEQRFRDAGAMREALVAAAAGLGAREKTGPAPYKPRDEGGRGWPKPALYGVAGALVIGAGVALAVWQPWQSDASTESMGPGARASEPEAIDPSGRDVAVVRDPGPPDPVEPEPVVEPVAATPEQTETRAEAHDIAAKLTPDQLTRVKPSLDEGDAAWEGRDWAAAAAAYGRAINVGKNLLVSDAAKARDGAVAARTRAERVNAAQNAAPSWQSATRSFESGAFADAERSYLAAEQEASRALDEARARERSADAAKAALATGCDRLAGEQAASCRSGMTQLDAGKAALARLDAAAAKTALARAAQELQKAGVKPPSPPPTLALSPSGRFELAFGGAQTIRATPTPADGVTVEFRVIAPDGSSSPSAGTTLQFRPSVAGRYRIVAVARNKQGQRSPEVALEAIVRPEPAKPRPPVVAVQPAGPVKLEAGKTQRFTATTQDPDGGAVAVRFDVQGPARIPPSAKGDSFDFRSATLGDYTITVSATDPTGLRAKPQSVRVTVVPPPPPPNRPPKLVRLEPAGSFEMVVGDTREFRAQAQDDDPGDSAAISYRVLQDGRSIDQASGPTFQFRPAAPGSYTIEASAKDRAGDSSAALRTTVSVAKKPEPPPAELAAFLKDYASAWEDRDIESLLALWQIPPAERGRIERDIDASQAVTVEIAFVEGSISGSGRAAQMVFRQTVTSLAGGQSKAIVSGKFFATLLKDNVGWRITYLQKQ